MTVLARYLTRQFTKFFMLGAGAFVLVFLLVDIIERARRLIGYHATALEASLYFLLKIPMIFYQICPVAVAIAVILTLGLMARHRELIAVQTSGLAPGIVIRPLIGVAALITLAVWVNNELVLPPAISASQQIWNYRIKKIPGRFRYRTHEIWFRGEGNLIYHVRFFAPSENRLEGVSLIWVDNEMRPLRRVEARRAVYDSDRKAWEFINGRQWWFSGDEVKKASVFDHLFIPLHETPEDFKVVERSPDEMSLKDLSKNIAELSREGFKTLPLRVQWHVKASHPFTSLIVAMIGIALGLRTATFTLGGSLVLSVVVVAGYWTILGVTVALGNSGVFPPWLAGWTSNLIFLGVGTLMLFTGHEKGNQ